MQNNLHQQKPLIQYLLFFHEPTKTNLDNLLTFCRQVPINYNQTAYITIDGQIVQTVTLKKQFRIPSPMNPHRTYPQHWVLFVQSSPTRSYTLSGKFSDTNGNQGYGRYIDFFEKYSQKTKSKETLINLMLYGTN